MIADYNATSFIVSDGANTTTFNDLNTATSWYNHLCITSNRPITLLEETQKTIAIFTPKSKEIDNVL